MHGTHLRVPMRAAIALLGSTALLAAIACTDGNAQPDAAPAPAPAAQAETGSGDLSGETVSVNMDEIFPPGPGRDLVLNNCQNCHTFVPIVILQMDQDAWLRNSLDHRERVTSLSDADFKTLYEYLAATFTPERPVPELPEALRNSWTSY